MMQNSQPNTYVGIDPQFNVNLATLEDVAKNFKTKINLQQEPEDLLRQSLQIMEQATVNPDLFKDKDAARKFFFNDFVGRVITNLTKFVKIKCTNKDFLATLKDVPVVLAHLLVRFLDDAAVLDGSKTFFDHKSRIFQYHYLGEDNQILHQNKVYHFSPEEQAWRDTLETGLEVDAIKVDLDGKSKMWWQGVIKQKSNNKVLVSYYKESAQFDREISIFSNELAPLNSNSKQEQDWRSGLKMGDNVDCQDSIGDWFGSTVKYIENKKDAEGNETATVGIAFRVYDENGDKADQQGKYFGWEAEFDDTLSLYSSKLAKYKSHTTDGKFKSESQQNNKEENKEIVDDSMDAEVLEENGQRIFAVHRKQCKSNLLIDFVNLFGRLGGFEFILNRIKENREEADEISLIATYIEIVGGCAPVLHKTFVNEFFGVFIDGIKQRFLASSRNQLKKLDKEKVNHMLEGLFSKLTPRMEGANSKDIQNLQHAFVLDLGMHFLNQDFLEKRVNGIKLIGKSAKALIDKIKTTDKGNPTAKVTEDQEKLRPAQEFVSKLMHNDYLFTQLFAKDNIHTQILERTEHILGLIFCLDALDESRREVLWKACQSNDQSEQTEMLKALTGASINMKLQDMVYFIQKIKALPFESIKERHMQLITEIGSLQHMSQVQELQEEVMKFYWDLTFESEDKCSLTIITQSSMAYVKTIKGLEFESQLKHICNLVTKLNENTQGHLVLKTLHGILKMSCDPPSKHPEFETLADVVNFLEEKHDLLQAVINNFKFYIGKVKAAYGSSTEKVSIEANVVCDLYMHADQITQRLEFIRFFTASSPKVQVKCHHLQTLWDLLIVESPGEKDEKQLYEWLREICDQVERINLKKGALQPVISIEELIKFYHSKVASSNNEELNKNLQIAGYQCRQSFFVLVNSIQGRLQKVNWDSGVFNKDNQQPTQKFTSYNNQTGAQYTSYSFNQNTGRSEPTTGGTVEGPKLPGQTTVGSTTTAGTSTTAVANDKKDKDENPDDLEVETVVAPNQLDGMDMLWQIALESTSKNVIDSAAKLLISLHHNVAIQLKDQISEFDDLFIEKVFSIIESQLPQIRTRTQEQKDQMAKILETLPQYPSQIQVAKVLPVQERRIVRALFLLRQMIRSSEKESTRSLRPHCAVNKGKTLSAVQFSNSYTGLQSSKYRQRLELSVDSNLTIWELKKKIGVELIKTSQDDGKTWDIYPEEGIMPKPVHPAMIRLYKMQQQKNIEDSNNGATLTEMCFKNNESIGVFKKSQSLVRKAPIVQLINEIPTLSEGAKRIAFEVFEKFAIKDEAGTDIWKVPQVISFTKTCTNTSSDESDYRVQNFMKNYDPDSCGFVRVEALENFFITSVVNGSELTLRNNFENLGYSPNLVKLPLNGDDDDKLQTRQTAEQMPRLKVSENQRHFEILMSLMDNDITVHVSARAQEALNFFATNPVLFKKTSFIGEDTQQEDFDWETIFGGQNINKMIYTLEILQTMLLNESDQSKLKKFVLNFIHKNGLQQLQQRLTNSLDNLGDGFTFAQKQFVDQLLHLLKMFVSSSKIEETVPKQDAEAQEQEEQQSDPQFTTPQKPITRHLEAADIVISKKLLFDDEPGQTQAIVPKPLAEVKDDSEDPYQFLKQVLADKEMHEIVVSKVDQHLLLKQTIELMKIFLVVDVVTLKDRPFIETSLQLWNSIQEELGDSQSQNKVLFDENLLTKGLISCKDKLVRECFRDSISKVAKNNKDMFQFLQEFVMKTLQNLSEIGASTWQFFGLVRKLISKSSDKYPAPSVDYSFGLLEILIQLLAKHEGKETKKNFLSDQTLQGLLESIADVISELKAEKENQGKVQDIVMKTDLISLVMFRCMFFQEGMSEKYFSEEERKHEKAKSQCLHKESRKAGLRVLKSYMIYLKPKELIEYIQNYLAPVLKEVERPKKFRYSPSTSGREDFCGIVNLGCICYMISTLQQFFMVPQFRYQLFKALDDTPEEMGTFKDELFDDNLLRQLQILYGNLELSERQAASAKGMCFAYKDIETGGPTSVSEQKDSSEFLNFFIDRLEEKLRPTSQKDLLSDIFKGYISDQLICPTCGIKNNIQPFYFLSLEVKGMQNVYESLDFMKAGEAFEGYLCDGCKQRINSTKRQIIGSTPNVLILHLKRFVFSFETMNIVKVNTHYEFPNTLNLKKYTIKEDNKETNDDRIKEMMQIDDDEFVYRLVGINIHSGTAQSGHYYSYINIDRGDKEPDPYTESAKWLDVNKSNWMEFNDAKVSEFQFETKVKQEAFGGSNNNTVIAATSDAVAEEHLAQILGGGSGSYGQNAYMLFYERKKKRDLTEYDGETKKVVEYKNVPKFIPNWIEKIVKGDNKEFSVDSQIFDPDFFDYIKDTLKLIANDLVMTAHQYEYTYSSHYFPIMKAEALDILVGKVVFDMLCYFEKNTSLSQFVSMAQTIFTFSDSKFAVTNERGGGRSIVVQFLKKYLLDDQGEHFFKIMLQCTDATSRTNAGKLIGNAIIRLIGLYQECHAEQNHVNVVEIKDALETAFNLFFSTLKLKETQKQWTKLEAYWQMLSDIFASSLAAKQFLMDRYDLISDMIDFILGQKSPRAAHETEKRQQMGAVIQPAFTPLYNLVSQCIRMCYTSEMDTDQRHKTFYVIKDSDLRDGVEVKTYFLSEEATLMLNETEFLQKVIFDIKYTECQEFASALAHICYKNLKLSRFVCKKMLKTISNSDNDQAARHLIILVELLTIKDEFQIHRLEYVFGFGFLNKNQSSCYSISTGLDARMYDDAVLNLLWKFKGRLDNFTITVLEKFGHMIVNDETIMNYISALPSPDNWLGHYLDWVSPYLTKQAEDAQKYSAGSGTQEKISKIALVQSYFEAYEQKKKTLDKMYIIQNLEEKEIVNQQNFDNAVEIIIKRVQGTFTDQAVSITESTEGPVEKSDVSYFCKDLVYQIEARNLLQQNIKLFLNFHKLSDDIDLIYPVGGLEDFIKPGQDQYVILLRRRNPFNCIDSDPLEIGKLNLQVTWKTYTQDDFNSSSYVFAGAVIKSDDSKTNSNANSSTIISQRRGGINLGTDTQVVSSSTGTDAMIAQSLDSFQDEAQKACPVCTLLNPMSATNCSLCDSQLT